MISTIVFDLDDTLYPEVDYCRSGFQIVAENLSSQTEQSTETIFTALWTEFEQGNRHHTFNAVLEQLDLDHSEQAVKALLRIYRNHIPRITLPSTSLKILTHLQHQYTLGLLTDGFLPAQRLKVRALKIGRFFKSIIYTEQLGREYWKPSPVGFERLMQSLNTNAAEMVYVGDNPAKDFLAPNQLGFTTIQVQNPQAVHCHDQDDPNAQAHYHIDTLASLAPLLKELSPTSGSITP